MVQESSQNGMEARDRLRWHRLPAVRALSVQFLSLICVILLMVALSVGEIHIPFFCWIALQAFCAAGLSKLFRLESWWLLIQFCFPFALWVASSLHLPSEIYLAAFLFCVALYWTTFRTRVPYYPSGPATWRSVVGMLPAAPIRFIDIGSGFGGLVLYLARQRSDCNVVGIELAPLPWIVSRARAALSGSAARFLRGDYTRQNFGDYDLVFAYLSPAAMPALWEKARAEMRPGSLLVSYEFAIPGVESQITNISSPNGRNLYGWIM